MNAQRPLTIVTRAQGNNRALVQGEVAPTGFALQFEQVPVLVDAFRRMVRGEEFDICEMAITTYLCAKEHGARFTALPIPLVRGFHHGAIVKPVGSDATPRDLAGTTVGVMRGYTVTTGVWARGILADEHGVDLDGITWARSGDEHVVGYAAPGNVTSLPAGTSIEDLLASGELGAAVGLTAADGRTEPVIDDPWRASVAALQERGFFPINHVIVVKDELLERFDDLGPAIFEAFAESKRRYVGRLSAGEIAQPDETDELYRAVMEITGADPLPFGVEPNRAVLETLIGYAVAQGIISHRPDLDGVFHPSTRGLSG